MLCQVCGAPADRDADGRLLWLLADDRARHPAWPEGEAPPRSRDQDSPGPGRPESAPSGSDGEAPRAPGSRGAAHTARPEGPEPTTAGRAGCTCTTARGDSPCRPSVEGDEAMSAILQNSSGDGLPGEPYPAHQPPTPDGGPGVPNPPKTN